MPGHRCHSIDFKRQVVAEHQAGERLSRVPDTALNLPVTRTDSVAGEGKKSSAEFNEKVALVAIRGEAAMRGPRR